MTIAYGERLRRQSSLSSRKCDSIVARHGEGAVAMMGRLGGGWECQRKPHHESRRSGVPTRKKRAPAYIR